MTRTMSLMVGLQIGIMTTTCFGCGLSAKITPFQSLALFIMFTVFVLAGVVAYINARLADKREEQLVDNLAGATLRTTFPRTGG